MSNSQQTEKKILESFVVDNDDLERLEGLLGKFNIFESLGAVRQELRHSAFLAFLFDPKGAHGMGDEFARSFLQNALAILAEAQPEISPIDLDVWDLSGLEVVRESQNIDILLTDKEHKLAVVIENKIDSGEHSEQLSRYRRIAEAEFAGWHRVFIFLTKTGESPTDSTYIAVDYSTVKRVLDRLIAKRESTLGADVLTLLTHYSQMLGRHIVEDSEIARLCRDIYKKHKQALDLIYCHKPDDTAVLSERMKELIAESGEFVIDTDSKSTIRFAPSEWEGIEMLKKGSGWTPSGRMLMFEFQNSGSQLKVVLYIGPGPEETRQRIFEIARGNRPMSPQSVALNPRYNSIYRHKLIGRVDEELPVDEVKETLERAWREFRSNDLAKIARIVSERLGDV